jgi:type I restriction enzyme S subunit
MSFPNYPALKSSGMDWIGEVPEHWYIYRSKNIFSERNVKAVESDEQLTASQKYGVIPQKLFSQLEDQKVVQVLLGRDILKKAEINDFVISMRSFQGGLEFSSYSGAVSSAYVPIYAKRELDYRYFKYLFKSKPFISALQNTSNLVRDGQALRYNNLIQLSLPFPSINEQRTIGAFLDHETARIDMLIKEQQRLIELLEEKRHAVISQVVTKGLDRSVSMKYSGVEWLGEVPAHWSVKALRYLGECQNGINIGGEAFGSGSPFVSYGDVYKNDTLPAEVTGLVNSSLEDRQRYSIEYGDVLFTRTSETVDEIGFSAVCLQDLKEAVFAGFLIRFRPFGNSLVPEFSKYYFRNQMLRIFFNKEMNLVTRASLSQDLLKQLPVTLPPIIEQIKISEYLDKITGEFASLLEQGRQSIDLLVERRSTLISVAVTGKIDVRGWQPLARVASPELEQEAV